jgi:hypothetical protein
MFNFNSWWEWIKRQAKNILFMLILPIIIFSIIQILVILSMYMYDTWIKRKTFNSWKDYLKYWEDRDTEARKKQEVIKRKTRNILFPPIIATLIFFYFWDKEARKKIKDRFFVPAIMIIIALSISDDKHEFWRSFFYIESKNQPK